MRVRIFLCMAIAIFCLVVMLSFFSLTTWADTFLLLHQDVQAKLSERWEAKFEIESKHRDNMSEYYDFEFMPWIAYCFTDWFTLGMGWRELYSRKTGTHHWDLEHRPLVDFMVSKKFKAGTVDNRIRTEYRDIEDTDAYFRYRNRLRYSAPWSMTRFEIKPWVAWETYYEHCPEWERCDRWNRHRYYIGLGAKINKSVKVGCYYYWENVLKSGEWKSNNEIGFDISFLFDFSRTAE